MAASPPHAPTPAPVPATARLFIALWPPPALREALAAWQGRWAWPAGARPVPAQRLHLTLQFLGSVPLPQVAALAQALRSVRPQPFTLHWGRVQDWDGIAVLRPLDRPAALQQLHEDCGAAARAAGLPTEARRFRPHLTLARKARGAQPPAQPLALEWACDGGFVLVHSVGQGGGYRVLEHFRGDGPGAAPADARADGPAQAPPGLPGDG